MKNVRWCKTSKYHTCVSEYLLQYVRFSCRISSSDFLNNAISMWTEFERLYEASFFSWLFLSTTAMAGVDESHILAELQRAMVSEISVMAIAGARQKEKNRLVAWLFLDDVRTPVLSPLASNHYYLYLRVMRLLLCYITFFCGATALFIYILSIYN